MKTFEAVCPSQDSEKASADDADPHPLILEMSEPKKNQKIHQFPRKLTICEKKTRYDLKKTLSNSFKISRHSLFFLEKFFQGVSRSEWNNWEWQVRNSITSLELLKNVVSL
nr:hypothetical protein [bacterium]